MLILLMLITSQFRCIFITFNPCLMPTPQDHNDLEVIELLDYIQQRTEQVFNDLSVSKLSDETRNCLYGILGAALRVKTLVEKPFN